MLLKDKVAIITGASKGIGRGVAIKFATEGCSVVVSARSPEGTRAVAEEITAMGHQAIAVPTDISNSSQVQVLIDQTLSAFGKIDILVNNVGIIVGTDPSASESIANISEEEWDYVLSVNLKGFFLCSKAVIPHMKRNGGGNIINFTSLGAVHPPTVSPHYHASKAGIIGLTYDMARELGPHQIRVNAVMPGPIQTPFFDNILSKMSEEERAGFFAGIAKTAPLQRMGTPEDCAGAALFLASELSAYTTAAVIPVTGGLPLQP